MKLVTLIVVFNLFTVLAQGKKDKRSADAHEHGAAKLDIAVDGLKGKVVWEVPLESITGFEHQAKSAADKKKLSDAENTIRTRFAEMIALPAAANCRVSVKEVEVEQHGEHSEMHTHAEIACGAPLTGEVRFGFTKFFPGIHKTAVQYVSDSVQTGVQLEGDKGVLKIGK